MRFRTLQLQRHYDAVEYVFGVACPLLSVLSVIDYFELVRWVWLFFFWMACGHYALHNADTYPPLKYRPFFRGLFAFGVGVAWPVWCTLHRRRKKLWG